MPAPHNVVVAQSTIPTPTLAQVTTPETPSWSTPNENDTNESDYESIVVVEPHVARIPIGSVATAPPVENSEPKVGSEFTMPKTPPPSNKPKRCPRTVEDRDSGRDHLLPDSLTVAIVMKCVRRFPRESTPQKLLPT